MVASVFNLFLEFLVINMNDTYCRIKKVEAEDKLPPSTIQFEIRVETDARQVYRLIQRALQDYKDEKKGPTLLSVQSPYGKMMI